MGAEWVDVRKGLAEGDLLEFLGELKADSQVCRNLILLAASWQRANFFIVNAGQPCRLGGFWHGQRPRFVANIMAWRPPPLLPNV
jgi:hypothetical protein